MSGRRFSLAQQIEEVDREIELRTTLYPVQVAAGKMRDSVAAYHLGRIQAVRATLVWLEHAERLIKHRCRSDQ